MTKKDYKLIASSFNKFLWSGRFGRNSIVESREEIERLLNLLEPKLMEDNPRFDTNKFREAIFQIPDGLKENSIYGTI